MARIGVQFLDIEKVSPPNHRVDGINRETDNYCLSNSGVIILHFS